MERNTEGSEWMVRLERVGVTYPNGTRALNPVSIDLRPGQFTVLLGLSGAGKSTLLRTINLLVRPTTGQVISDTLGRVDSSAAIRAHRRRTAMIFQQHQLLLRKTALTNVLTGRLGVHPAWRTVMPMPREDVLLAQECLERVGLGDKAFVRADNLSGGQMQRVGIARALAQQPRMILADEPVASLDPTTAVQVLDQLDRIGREDDIATVVSLHQLELARRFAQRIIGLAGGDVIFDGPPTELDRHTLDRIYGTATVPGDVPAKGPDTANDKDEVAEPARAVV